MFKLARRVAVLIVVVVVVAAVAGDMVARRRAQATLVDAVVRNVPGATDVSASVSSFPFLGHLLVQGRVAEVDVRIGGVAAPIGGRSAVDLTDVQVDVHDVDLDTGEALHGQARVTAIGRGHVQASISQDALQRLLPRGVSVHLAAGSAQVTGPLAGSAEIVATGTGKLALRLGRPQVVIPIPLPTATVLTCPPQVAIADGTLTLSCSFRDVPRILVDRVRG